MWKKRYRLTAVKLETKCYIEKEKKMSEAL